MLEKRAWEMNLVDKVDCFFLDITLFNPFISEKIQLPQTGDFYHKIVFSEIPSKRNSVTMLVGSRMAEFKFWVPGALSWRSTNLVGDPFQDATFCNGSFFLLTKENNIVQIDVKTVSRGIAADSDSEIETRLHKLAGPDNEEMNTSSVLRYLVESCGNVLLVCRYFNDTPGVILETRGFKVYALDLGKMSWKRVRDLGDRLLFLGKCSSRSFSARELGSVWMANSIYLSNVGSTSGIFTKREKYHVNWFLATLEGNIRGFSGSETRTIISYATVVIGSTLDPFGSLRRCGGTVPTF